MKDKQTRRRDMMSVLPRKMLLCLTIVLLEIASLVAYPLASLAAAPQTPLETIWYSGSKNSKFLIEFSSNIEKVTCGDPVGQSGGFDGTANLTDPNSGKLRLYTDGYRVFNGQSNKVLKNGTGLYGNSNVGEAAMIVPVPGTNPDRFYIFTNKITNVYYSIADLSQGPEGAITVKNQMLASNTGEALGIVPHSNGKDFWLLVFNTAAKVDAYLVNESGIASDPVSSYTGFYGGIYRGSIIHSPDLGVSSGHLPLFC